MRVALLNEFFHPDRYGGTGKVLSDLARRLNDDHQMEVSAFTTSTSYRGESRALADQEDWDGVSITRYASGAGDRQDLSKRLKSDLAYTRAAHRFLREDGPHDAVLVSTAPPTLPMAAWGRKRLKGTPYVYVIYDLEPDRAVTMGVAKRGSVKERALRSWQKRWLNQADKVIAIGRCMKDRLCEEYGVLAENVRVISVGEDHEAIRPQPYPQETFTVLYSGNFGRYHDFNPLLDAAKALQEDARFRFRMVGGGKKKDEVAAQAADLANVQVEGFVPPDEFESLLGSASISVVTLEPGMEGLCVPSKFYSILASGRPTLALLPKTCEVSRVVESERCGVVLSEPTGESIAKALRTLADQPDEAKCMGQRARAALERAHSSQKVAEEFADTLREVARG